MTTIRGFTCALALSSAVAFGASAAAAEAASAPGLYTGSAAEVTATTAKLTGGVNPKGQASNYYFEYGTTTAYGGVTPLTPVGAGTSTVSVAAHISGLTAYTTYHFRIVASNASGTLPGRDRSFTTAKVPFGFSLSFPQTDVFGTPLTVSGTLTGTGAANHPVVLQVSPFPYLKGFTQIGNPELTDADGYFAFPALGLSQNTQLRVVTLEKHPVDSQTVLEHLAARVALHVRPAARSGYARFYGTVAPAQGLARVYFQLLRPGRAPRTLGSEVIGDRGGVTHFSHLVRIRHAGLYRAYVQVPSGEVSSNHSRPLLIG